MHFQPARLADYYKSIEQPFAETRKVEEKERKVGFLGVLIILCFVFSLLPVIPWLLSIVLPKLAGAKTLSILGQEISVNSFWFLWPACFVLFLLLLILSLKAREPSEQVRSRLLSPAQMRFAYCYGTLREMEKYQTTRLQRYAQSAQTYLDSLFESLRELTWPYLVFHSLGPRIHPLHEEALWRAETIQGGSLEALTHRLKWFKLDPQTQKILDAFSHLPSKFKDRLRDRKELSNLSRALTQLSTYLYTEIPEIPEISEGSEEDNREWQEIGAAALSAFADEVNALPPYTAQLKPVSPKEAVSRRLASRGSKLAAFFVHENILIRFFSWYFLSLFLIATGFWIAFRCVPTLSVDTVIISTIVGGPVGLAITGVTIARIGGSRTTATDKQGQESQERIT